MDAKKVTTLKGLRIESEGGRDTLYAIGGHFDGKVILITTTSKAGRCKMFSPEGRQMLTEPDAKLIELMMEYVDWKRATTPGLKFPHGTMHSGERHPWGKVGKGK